MKKYFPILKYINIPNSITTLGLTFGVAACYFLVEGSLRNALICLALAMIMDVFDGFFAGKLNRQTSFGQSLDSLVDFFVCCVIPVLMVFTFTERSLVLIVLAVFYSICGLWRLSHYNVVAQSAEKSTFFTGLPVPGACVLSSMTMWLVVYHYIPTWTLALVLLLVSLLMVSFIKFTKYGVAQKVFWVLGGIFLGIIALS